jgi:GT2 family glycosyltransferase
MTANPQPIAIVLVNWNGWRDVADCLDSVLASDDLPFHLYVVDNDSADGSVEKIVAWCNAPVRLPDARDLDGVRRLTDSGGCPPVAFRLIDSIKAVPALTSECRVSIVRSGGNLGFAGGNNVGLQLALQEGCEWFWLLNTDTAIRHDALSCLLARARRSPDIGITGSTLVFYGDPECVQAVGGALDESRVKPSHIGEGLRLKDVPGDPSEIEAKLAYIVGASMLVPRAFLEQVGLMQDDYFLYYEELDWAMRARGRFKLAWAPDSIVWHKVGGSSTKREESVSLFSLGLMCRNRIKFAARFLPQGIGAVKRGLCQLALFYCKRGRFREARVVVQSIFRAAEMVRQGRRT